eukprot:gene11800-5134_t
MKTLEEEEIKKLVEEKILKDISLSYKSNPLQGLLRICPICTLSYPTLVFQNHMKICSPLVHEEIIKHSNEVKYFSEIPSSNGKRTEEEPDPKLNQILEKLQKESPFNRINLTNLKNQHKFSSGASSGSLIHSSVTQMQQSSFNQKEIKHDDNWMDSVYDSAKKRYEYNNNLLSEIFYSTESNFDLYEERLENLEKISENFEKIISREDVQESPQNVKRPTKNIIFYKL